MSRSDDEEEQFQSEWTVARDTLERLHSDAAQAQDKINQINCFSFFLSHHFVRLASSAQNQLHVILQTPNPTQ